MNTEINLSYSILFVSSDNILNCFFVFASNFVIAIFGFFFFAIPLR